MAGLILPQTESFSQYANLPLQPPTPVLETIPTRSEHSTAADAEAALLSRYTFTSNTFPSPSQPATCKETSSPVLITRILATTPLATTTRRSISLTWAIPHPIIPPICEWLSTPSTLYVITPDIPRRTLTQLVEAGGPVPPDGLKDVMTQLFAGLAHLFLHRIAPLRVTAENMLFDAHSGLVLAGWEDAVEYAPSDGEERLPGQMYAGVKGRGESDRDIYTAPEAWEGEGEYNARKAVVWTCGVVLYYMATAQTARLADLGHPATLHSDIKTKRRYSLTTKLSKDLPKIINYPSRHRVPSWAINIVSRMLLFDPVKRPELIEVAAKVPKMPGIRGQRPLMEAAYLDYKWNVGPVGVAVEELMNEGDGVESAASSIFGGAGSVFSVSSVTGLLGGGRVGGSGG